MEILWIIDCVIEKEDGDTEAVYKDELWAIESLEVIEKDTGEGDKVYFYILDWDKNSYYIAYSHWFKTIGN